MSQSKQVTDPEILAQLNAGRANPTIPNAGGQGAYREVTDPAILAQLNGTKPQESSIIDNIIGSYDLGANILTGIVAEPIAGLAGIGSSIFSGTDAGANTVKSVRDSLTYQPRSEAGKNKQAALGELLSPLAEGLEGVSTYLGDGTLDLTGSPELATLSYSAPQFALELLGIKGAPSAARGVANIANKPSAAKTALNKENFDKLSDPLLKYDPDVASFKLDANNQVIPDKDGIALQKKGLDPVTTGVMMKTTPQTRAYMADMFDIYVNSASGNKMYKAVNSPNKVLGTPIVERIKFLDNKKTALGAELDTIVKNEIAQVDIPVAPLLSSVIDETKKLFNVEPILNRIVQQNTTRVPFKDRTAGVTTKPKKIELTPLERTPMDTPALKQTKAGIENLISLLLDYSGSSKKLTGTEAHFLKKAMDDFIDIGIKEGSSTGNVQKIISAARQQINDTLRASSKNYEKVNNDYGVVLEAQAPFNKVKMQMEKGDSWANVVGAKLSPLKGEAANSQVLSAELIKLDSAVSKMGGKFDDELLPLFYFKQGVDEAFKIPDYLLRQTAEDVAKRSGKVVVDGLSSAALGNVFGAGHDFKRLVENRVNTREMRAILKDRQKLTQEMKTVLKKDKQ